MENIIRIENLVFEYSKETEEGQVSIRAVDDVSFEIEKGRLSFRLTAPYSEERKPAASEWAKKNGVRGRKCYHPFFSAKSFQAP